MYFINVIFCLPQHYSWWDWQFVPPHCCSETPPHHSMECTGHQRFGCMITGQNSTSRVCCVIKHELREVGKLQCLSVFTTVVAGLFIPLDVPDSWAPSCNSFPLVGLSLHAWKLRDWDSRVTWELCLIHRVPEIRTHCSNRIAQYLLTRMHTLSFISWQWWHWC